MNIQRITKPRFAIIGKEGSTNDGKNFVGKLWESANQNFQEIAGLIKIDENGYPLGIWGAMSDFSHSFLPWQNNYSQGLYLAGAECGEDAQAPEKWVKWVLPSFEYLQSERENSNTFYDTLQYLKDNNLKLAGAVQELDCPASGKSYLLFPIKRLDG